MTYKRSHVYGKDRCINQIKRVLRNVYGDVVRRRRVPKKIEDSVQR